MAACYN